MLQTRGQLHCCRRITPGACVLIRCRGDPLIIPERPPRVDRAYGLGFGAKNVFPPIRPPPAFGGAPKSAGLLAFRILSD